MAVRAHSGEVTGGCVSPAHAGIDPLSECSVHTSAVRILGVFSVGRGLWAWSLTVSVFLRACRALGVKRGNAGSTGGIGVRICRSYGDGEGIGGLAWSSALRIQPYSAASTRPNRATPVRMACSLAWPKLSRIS